MWSTLPRQNYMIVKEIKFWFKINIELVLECDAVLVSHLAQ